MEYRIPSTLSEEQRAACDAVGLEMKHQGTDLKNVNIPEVKLVNGMKMKTNQALEAAEKFLGKGYKDMGNGRYVSMDGFRQVRMGDPDILGYHAGGPHMNFDTLKPKYKSIHIFLGD